MWNFTEASFLILAFLFILYFLLHPCSFQKIILGRVGNIDTPRRNLLYILRWVPLEFVAPNGTCPCSMAQDRAGCSRSHFRVTQETKRPRKDWHRVGERSWTTSLTYFLEFLSCHLSASLPLPILPKIIILKTFLSLLIPRHARMSHWIFTTILGRGCFFVFNVTIDTNEKSQTRSRAGTGLKQMGHLPRAQHLRECQKNSGIKVNTALCNTFKNWNLCRIRQNQD